MSRDVEPCFKPDGPEWALADAVPVVQARSRWSCEAAGDCCTGRAEVIHHKAGRRVHDAHNPDRLLHCCDACHRDIHANPKRSRSLGHMESRVAVPHRENEDER